MTRCCPALLFSLLIALAWTLSCVGDDDDSSGATTGDVDDDTGDDDFDDDTDDDTSDDDADDDTSDDDTDDDTDDDIDDDSDDDSDDDADDDSDDDADDDTTETTVSGAAYRFDWTFTRLEGATVEILERPDLPPVVTDTDGAFSFNGVYAGHDTTLVLHEPAFWPTMSATLTPDEAGITDATLQVPPRLLVRLLSLWLLVRLDPDRCQIAVTATEAGGTPFSPGLAGVRVGIDPPLPADSGPFYFQYFDSPNLPPIDLPIRGLTETTDDGGAIYVNVPPGDYVLSAESDDATFTTARIKCRAGYLVNAAPPYGLHPIADRRRATAR